MVYNRGLCQICKLQQSNIKTNRVLMDMEINGLQKEFLKFQKTSIQKSIPIILANH